MKKRIPIGIEFYKEMIEKNFYYVDKTEIIQEILDSQAKVNLFMRPRRFGKTLTQNTIRVFFEDERDARGCKVDNRHYFDGTTILSKGMEYTDQMGQYPVINMSLKSAKQPDFEAAYMALREQIIKEYDRHSYILQSDLVNENRKKRYRNLWDGEAAQHEYATSLQFLSECLETYHGRKTIILLDEYDVPLESAHFWGFYSEMVSFIRLLFESALKTNESLEFAVITGCLRVSQESIFTGLNNLTAISVLNDEYTESFGFTQTEVDGMLAYYDISDKGQELKEWYDGYLFGHTEIYNPWSVVNYIKALTKNPSALPKPYWSNTSSNSIIKELVEGADLYTRKEIEELIAGGQVEKAVHEDITYGDIHDSKDNLWNFLFFTGYLKKVGERAEEGEIYLKMSIPNKEINLIYRNTVLSWFDKRVRGTDLSLFARIIESGDCEAFGNFLSEQLLETISFFDYAENYYHGFLVGLLKGIGCYEVVSNRESGKGRPDIIMKSPSLRGKAYVMELKVAGAFQEMDTVCQEALRQAVEQNYRAELEQDGYLDITIYGICFYKKECRVIKGS